MNKRIFAWSGVMMLLAAIFVWGMTGHPKAAGESAGGQRGRCQQRSCERCGSKPVRSNRKQFDACTDTYACGQP